MVLGCASEKNQSVDDFNLRRQINQVLISSCERSILFTSAADMERNMRLNMSFVLHGQSQTYLSDVTKLLRVSVGKTERIVR